MYDSENDSEPSSLSKLAETPKCEAEGVKMDIIQVGEVVQYTIPSFPVLTVYLRHCVTRVWDNTEEKVKMFDAFLREGPDIITNVPSSVEVVESCNICVSHPSIHNLHGLSPWAIPANKDTPLLSLILKW